LFWSDLIGLVEPIFCHRGRGAALAAEPPATAGLLISKTGSNFPKNVNSPISPVSIFFDFSRGGEKWHFAAAELESKGKKTKRQKNGIPIKSECLLFSLNKKARRYSL